MTFWDTFDLEGSGPKYLTLDPANRTRRQPRAHLVTADLIATHGEDA
jgi:hypothetical protein